MRIADREQGALHLHRVVHRGAGADAPVVDVATVLAGWNRTEATRLIRRDTGRTEMRSQRNAHARQGAVAVAGGTAGDGAWNGIFPGKVVGVQCLGGMAARVDPIDR